MIIEFLFIVSSLCTRPIKASCIVPNVTNAIVTVDGVRVERGKLLESGTFIEVSCPLGYLPNDGGGIATSFCASSGQWFPSKPFSTCQNAEAFFSQCENGLNGEYPWLAKLEIMHLGSRDRKICSGSVINRNWILTTGSCLKEGGPITALIIYLGQENWPCGSLSGEQVRSPHFYKVHPLYNKTNQFDFALIRLNYPVMFTSKVRKICLPSRDQCHSKLARNSSLVVVDGCSNVFIADSVRSLSRQANAFSMLKDENCGNMTAGQICVGGGECGSSSSGRHLMCRQEWNSTYAIGIGSSGNAYCGTEQGPAIFGRICSVITWIDEATSERPTDIQPVENAENVASDQGEVIKTVGFLEYPGGGRKYDNFENRCWNITADFGNGIQFKLLFVNLPCCGDLITIYNGTLPSSSIIYNNSWIMGVSYYVPANPAKLCFTSNIRRRGRGFKFSYKGFQVSAHERESENPIDCEMLRNRGIIVNGIYTIYPSRSSQAGIRVYCDMTSFGGGWTVFQRRIDASQTFAKTWNDYKYGFGDLIANFWLGNDAIHSITKTPDQPEFSRYTLFVKAVSADRNETAFVNFDMFFIYNETLNYKIHFHPYPICDSTQSHRKFAWQNHQDFSTMDRDNDAFPNGDCSKNRGNGGWWFKRCHNVYLNGIYSVSNSSGIVWSYFKGDDTVNTVLKTTEMMIRRSKVDFC